MSFDKTRPALFGRSLPVFHDLGQEESDDKVSEYPFELTKECKNEEDFIICAHILDTLLKNVENTDNEKVELNEVDVHDILHDFLQEELDDDAAQSLFELSTQCENEENSVICEHILDGLLKNVENTSNEKDEACMSELNFDGIKNSQIHSICAEFESSGPSVTEFQSIVSDLHQNADKYTFSQPVDIIETAQTIAFPESQQKFSDDFNNNFKQPKSNQTDSLRIVSKMSQTDDRASEMKDSATQSMSVETQGSQMQTMNYKKDLSTQTDKTSTSEIECQTEKLENVSAEVQTDATSTAENECQTEKLENISAVVQTDATSTAENECQTNKLGKVSTEVQVDQNTDPNHVQTREASTSTSWILQKFNIDQGTASVEGESSSVQKENNNYGIVVDGVVMSDVQTRNDGSTTPMRPNEMVSPNVLEAFLKKFIDSKKQDEEIQRLKKEILSLKISTYFTSSLDCLPNEFPTLKQHEERMAALRKSNDNVHKLFVGHDCNTTLLSNVSLDNSSFCLQQQQGPSFSQRLVQPFPETDQSYSKRSEFSFSRSTNQQYCPLETIPNPIFSHAHARNALYRNNLPTCNNGSDIQHGLNETTPSTSSNTAQTHSKHATKRKTSDTEKRPAKKRRGRPRLLEKSEQCLKKMNSVPENVDLAVRGTKNCSNKKSQYKKRSEEFTLQMDSEKRNDPKENQHSFFNEQGSKNCLIHISSSDEDVLPEDVLIEGFTQLDWWRTGGQGSSGTNEKLCGSIAEEEQEFPEEERWWPRNDNSEWNIPEVVETGKRESAQKKNLGYDDEYEEDYDYTSNYEEENNNDINYRDEERRKENTEYTSISFSKRSIHKDDPTDKFRTMHLGKVVKNKTYVLPKLMKVKFFIDCTPQQYEAASGNMFDNNASNDTVFPQKTSSSENDNWVFYKETTRCVVPLPPGKYKTFSYEINTEYKFHIPAEIESDVEFYFGTIRDPTNESA